MINYAELKDWQDSARSGLREEIDCLEEKSRQINSYMRVLDAMDEQVSENHNLKETVERQQREIDDLEEQLEQKQMENDNLRRQLLEAQNLQLETEKQQLETEVSAKPTEIHNHFERGSSAQVGSTSQVFNDKVNGRFAKGNDKKKKEKKRWKRMVRKVL